MSHKYLILGLLAQNPMTGYDMRKHVQDVLSVVTNASYGTLYPTLHKLLDDGAVQMDEVEQEGRPSKKVYQITNKGTKDLQGWLKQPPADDKIKREFLLKLYFAQEMPEQDLRKMLLRRREEMQVRLASLYTEREAANDPRQKWILDYALSMYQAEMTWLEQVQDDLSIA
jgi:PadR family transcriptional regulator, regulatory protein AphA